MTKQIVSFIVIFIAFAVIGGAVLIGTSNFGLGFNGENDSEICYAYAIDPSGYIYCICDNGITKSLISMDSSGKKLFKEDLDPDIFGSSFYVDQIYIDYDKNIYTVVYEFNENTGFVNNASIHYFLEDGSYAGEIFSREVSVYPNARSQIISSMSDDGNVHFAYMTDGQAEIFSVSKNSSDTLTSAVSTMKYYNIGEIYGAIALSDTKLAVGSKDGIIIYDKDEQTKHLEGVFDRFWANYSGFYTLDSVNGMLYYDNYDKPIRILESSALINVEDDLTLLDLSEIAVGVTGNFFGTVRGETENLYYGSFSVISKINADITNKTAMINRILVIAAVCAGVILLSILTWDFFRSILKMRLSILLRQSLLIIMMLFVALYSLLYFVMIPNVENMVRSNYIHEAELVANSFENSLKGSANGAADKNAYEQFLLQYGASCEFPRIDEFSGDDETPKITLVDYSRGSMRITASSEFFPSGSSGDKLIYDHSLSSIIRQMTENETSFLTLTPKGEQLCLVRSTSLMNDIPAYIIVQIGVKEVTESVDRIRSLMDLFLLLGGVIIVIVFMMIEGITAGAVRRLKRSVDKIAIGEYNAPINIRTGDEVEELSISVKALAAHIVEKTTSLEKLNNSYYRFVPQTFLANLGETQIERVKNSLHTQKHMALLFISFDFSQRLSRMDAKDIFDSINSVYKQIMPILDKFGGTGHNFRFNGLSAIFPDSTKNALQAAIKIRETIKAYNEPLRSENRRTVDVRMVISEGEVLLGFIGDDNRMEPTVVSSAINEAEDIEKILSDSGLYIVCTERAFRSLPSDKYRSRCIGNFVTSEGSVKLFDMYDSDPYALTKLKEQFITRFEVGVSLFEKQDFVNSRNMFMDIVKYASDDGVSRNYMYLSEHNISAENKQLTYTVYTDAMAGAFRSDGNIKLK